LLHSPYLQFEGVTKTFPGVRALDEVSFGVRQGSIHALLGENGAGKSTLLKILSGAYRPDGGTLSIDGTPHVFRTTSEAIAAGVAVIYQELHLVPEMSVAENLFLGHLPGHLGIVKRGELLQRTRRQLEMLGEAIDPGVRVSSLSLAQRQMVEIAKALSHDATVIAFDEPTSSLSAREVEHLFAVIAELKRQGKVILYVSHRMDEIFSLCDAATVFRDGRHVETFESLEGVSPDTLVQRMVGRSIENIWNYSPRPHGETALKVEGLMGPGLIAPASFEVERGEILGFFGLVGAGRSELMRLLYGAVRKTAGQIEVQGHAVDVKTPRDAIRMGIVFCPEDRKGEGIVGVRSVQENLNLSGRRHFSGLGFWIDEKRERANALDYIRKLSIKTPSPSQLIVNLSGGNQQKVILARWLSEEVKVILLDEPTRGIDVGAKSEIYNIIYDLARQGIGVIVVSSELPEVLGICDRLFVMRQGQLVGELSREQATPEKALQMALPVENLSSSVETVAT